jgi:uncharacterized protein
MTFQDLKRNISRTSIVLFFIFMESTPTEAKAPIANSLLWEISGNGLKQSSYLFGTQHAGCRSKIIPPSNQLQKLNNVQQVYFELNLKESKETPKPTHQIISMPDGKVLKDITTFSEYQELETAFGSVTLKEFARVNPKYLPVLVGYNFLDGRDMNSFLSKFCKNEITSTEEEMLQIAIKYKKEIYGIETFEERETNFKNSIPVQEDLQILLSTIRNIDSNPRYSGFKMIMELYSSQDIYGLHKYAMSSMKKEPNHLKAILYDRNRLWLTRMRKIMSEKSTFFAFGAAHLGGEEGLISLLESKGYTLRPIFGNFSPRELVTQKTDSEYLKSGDVKANNDNLLGALEDYNQSLTLNSKYADAYFKRGNIKEKLFDILGALADYNNAISIDKQYGYYEQRGLLKQDKLKDLLGAIEDFNQCIKIQPDYTTPYYRRGLIRSEKLSDFSGALSDFNKVIELHPQSMKAHYARGILKYNKLNDRVGGIADVNRAILLAKFHNETNFLEAAQAVLKVMEGR